MWLLISLNDCAVVGVYYDERICKCGLAALREICPDYVDSARLVIYHCDADEFQHCLNPIIISCLDKNHVVLS